MDIDQIMTSIKIYSNKTIVSKEKKNPLGIWIKRLSIQFVKGKKENRLSSGLSITPYTRSTWNETIKVLKGRKL